MKSTIFAALVAVVSADACDCLLTEAGGLPPSSLFTDKDLAAEYGSKCGVWDTETAGCEAGGEYADEAWCTSEWCYVDATTCEGALDTMFFDETEYADTLKWSMETCAAETGSVAMYASAMAVTLAAVAASI